MCKLCVKYMSGNSWQFVANVLDCNLCKSSSDGFEWHKLISLRLLLLVVIMVILMLISLIVFGNIHLYCNCVIVLVVALSLRRPQNGKWFENVCVCVCVE